MEKKYDGSDLVFLVIITALVCFFLGMSIIGFVMSGRVDDLGTAICEEKYNASYRYYSGGVLHCEPLMDTYDGIKVKLGGEDG